MAHNNPSHSEQWRHPLRESEPVLERLLFRNRIGLLLVFIFMSVLLGYQATQLRPDASFEKMIPTSHPFIANFLDNRDDLSGLGNSIRVAVETTEEDIFSAEFMEVLKQVNDELFFIPGVDRAALKSIWTPNVRWKEVTEAGFVGGPVIPPYYDGSKASLADVRANILRSGQVGRLVANNFRSAIIHVPLLDIDPQTGERLDYQAFSRDLEMLIRDKYQSETVRIHITGFAKVVGDLIEGASQVALFFALAVVITLILLSLYFRNGRSVLVTLGCSLIAVAWQLGMLRLLGYGLDPYSMLVPFLVFAIAVSHGVQIVNAIAQETVHGADAPQAARRAFRALYIPGLIALVSDGIGFMTLMIIDIGVIQDLAIAASIGVAAIILSNLVLLPILMSYIGVGSRAAAMTQPVGGGAHYRFARGLTVFTRPRGAAVSVIVALSALLVGGVISQDLKIGDLDQGAPELRPDSRYNLDNAFMTMNYSASSDVFVVMVKTAPEQCASYANLATVDRFQGQMQNVAGVQTTFSLVDVAKRVTAGMNEGNLKWQALNRNQYVINAALAFAPSGLINADCSMTPVLVYLNNHKADTLQQVVAAATAFAERNNTDALQFELAAGNAGIEAATNSVIEKAQYAMLAWVYGIVALLCWLTFRSWRTVLCIIAPLALTSVLCQALMTLLGIGVKVATLPVIALGVGIGVDYGIYIYSRLETHLREGLALNEAYFLTLKSTGKAVAFTGLPLAIGVGTWVLSPIKFQADMGILLTFMFLWNMLGALVLLPALAHYLVYNRGRDDSRAEKNRIITQKIEVETWSGAKEA